MRVFQSPRSGYCASCEGALTGRPVYRMDEAYCCVGCAHDGRCVCNVEADLADDGVDRLGWPFPMTELVPAQHHDPAVRMGAGRDGMTTVERTR